VQVKQCLLAVYLFSVSLSEKKGLNNQIPQVFTDVILNQQNQTGMFLFLIYISQVGSFHYLLSYLIIISVSCQAPSLSKLHTAISTKFSLRFATNINHKFIKHRMDGIQSCTLLVLAAEA